MSRTRYHGLANASVGAKLVATFGILLGLAIFSSTTLVEVVLTDWKLSLSFVILEWGGLLLGIAERSPRLFAYLFFVHAGSLTIVVAILSALVRRLALPRGARVAVASIVASLALADVACWALIRSFWWIHDLLGPIVSLETIVLALLAIAPLREIWIYPRWTPKSANAPTRVAIVGGGFAGLYAAIELDRLLGYHERLEITLIDRKNYFLFPPLLPSVATGAIETRQVTYPFRRIFEATNVVFRKEQVVGIDTRRRSIRSQAAASEDAPGAPRETPYDVLVLAPGSAMNTFGTPGVAEHAFFMRELGDATAFRNQIIDCFERAAHEVRLEKRRELLTFVVVGAGPTGIELASELRDLIVHVLLNRYPEIDRREVAVTIVQSGAGILPGFGSPGVATRAAAQLEKLDIRVLVNRRVVAVDPRSVTLDGGETIATRTCVWCAGVKPSPLLEACDLPRHPSGRVEVNADLRPAGHPDTFVLGDAAYLHHRDKPLPPLGQVAFQQGTHAARNIVRLLRGKTCRPFAYTDFGALVSVGEHFAVVELLGVKLSGFVAWLVWRALYLTKLVGFGNKVRVLVDWNLDLLVERSIAQIAVSRLDVRETAANAAPR